MALRSRIVALVIVALPSAGASATAAVPADGAAAVAVQGAQ
jgi:hypothetical protein